MDEVEKRLREICETTLTAYQGWHAAKKNAESREILQDAIHEMRKVAARLEIEIAVSEREEMQARPIPIPPHRATRKRQGEDEEGDNAGNFSEGNGNNQAGHQGSHGGGGGPQRHVLRRRSQHQGGGGSGGGNYSKPPADE
jgi:hypothetical protein